MIKVKTYFKRDRNILFAVSIISICFGFYFLHKTSKYLYLDELKRGIGNNTYKKPTLDFGKIHQDIIDSAANNRTPQQKQKVVFHVPRSCGYGNRIYSMLSSFLVAVLTESALLIDWPPIGQYIECPLKDAFRVYDGDEIFLNYKYETSKICDLATVTNNTWSYDKTISNINGLELPKNCSRYLLSGCDGYFFDLAARLDNAIKLVEYGFVRAETVKRAESALNDIDEVESQKLEYLYSIGFEFAGHVLNNYWKLKPHLSEKVNAYVRKYFDGFFMIGIQMRYHFLNQNDIDAFVNCTKKIEARRHRDSSVGGDRRPTKWFVSSDLNEIVNEFIEIYPNKVVTTNETLGHILYDENAYEKTLLDIELFSRCDELIITGGSTFGFTVALKMQKRPFYVEGKRSMSGCKLTQLHAPPRRPEGYSLF